MADTPKEFHVKEYDFNKCPKMKGVLSVKNGTCIGGEGIKWVLSRTVIKPNLNPEIYDAIPGFRKENKHLLFYGPPGSGIRSIVLAVCKDERLRVIVVPRFGSMHAKTLLKLVSDKNRYTVVLFDQTIAFDMNACGLTPMVEFFNVLNAEFENINATFIWSPGDIPNKVYHPSILSLVDSNNTMYAFPFTPEAMSTFYETTLRSYAARLKPGTKSLDALNQFIEEGPRRNLIEALVKCSVACTPGDVESFLTRVFQRPYEDISITGGFGNRILFPKPEDFNRCMWIIDAISTVSRASKLPFKRNNEFLAYQNLKYDVIAFQWSTVATNYDKSIPVEVFDEQPTTTTSSTSKRPRAM